MPFTFKLSQRLARMRCAALLLSTATCVAGEKPEVVVSPAPPPSQNNPRSFAVGRTEAGDNVAVARSRGRNRERDTAEFFDSCERVAARGADAERNPKLAFLAVVFIDSARWAQAVQPLL